MYGGIQYSYRVGSWRIQSICCKFQLDVLLGKGEKNIVLLPKKEWRYFVGVIFMTSNNVNTAVTTTVGVTLCF